MGYYIQHHEPKGKVSFIINTHNGVVIPQPKSFDNIDKDLGLICVLDNGPFEAAGYAYNEKEFKAFSNTVRDARPRTWLVIDKALANDLTGYSEDHDQD